MEKTSGNREKILRCAMEMFHQKGYASTSVDDLLRECGVAKSNFYYHFRTKDDLALASLEAYHQAHKIKSTALLTDPSKTPLSRLSLYFEGAIQAQTQAVKAGCPFGNFASSLICETQLSTFEREKQQRFRQALTQVFTQMEMEISSCLREGRACGEIRDDLSEDALALLTLATLQGLMVLAKAKEDRRFLVEGLVALRKILAK